VVAAALQVVTDDIAAHLIIEVDGNNMDVLMSDMEDMIAKMHRLKALGVKLVSGVERRPPPAKRRLTP